MTSPILEPGIPVRGHAGPVDSPGRKAEDLFGLTERDWGIIRQLYGVWDRHCPIDQSLSMPGNQGLHITKIGVFVPCSVPQVSRIARQVLEPNDEVIDLGGGLLHFAVACLLGGARSVRAFEGDAEVHAQANQALPYLRGILNSHRLALNLEADCTADAASVGGEILALEYGNFLSPGFSYDLGREKPETTLLFSYYNHSCAAFNDRGQRSEWYGRLRNGSRPARLLVYGMGQHGGSGREQMSTSELEAEFGPALHTIHHVGVDYPDRSEVYRVR